MTWPVFRPSGFSGTVTTRRSARTVKPTWEKTRPSEQLLGKVPWLSQNCSFRIKNPIPGTSITVLGGGFAPTGVPITTSPTSSVPPASENAPKRFAVLFDWDLTTVAPAVQPADEGMRQTWVTWAKLEAVLASVVSAPLL